MSTEEITVRVDADFDTEDLASRLEDAASRLRDDTDEREIVKIDAGGCQTALYADDIRVYRAEEVGVDLYDYVAFCDEYPETDRSEPWDSDEYGDFLEGVGNYYVCLDEGDIQGDYTVDDFLETWKDGVVETARAELRSCVHVGDTIEVVGGIDNFVVTDPEDGFFLGEDIQRIIDSDCLYLSKVVGDGNGQPKLYVKALDPDDD